MFKDIKTTTRILTSCILFFLLFSTHCNGMQNKKELFSAIDRISHLVLKINPQKPLFNGDFVKALSDTSKEIDASYDQKTKEHIDTLRKLIKKEVPNKTILLMVIPENQTETELLLQTFSKSVKKQNLSTNDEQAMEKFFSEYYKTILNTAEGGCILQALTTDGQTINPLIFIGKKQLSNLGILFHELGHEKQPMAAWMLTYNFLQSGFNSTANELLKLFLSPVFGISTAKRIIELANAGKRDEELEQKCSQKTLLSILIYPTVKAIFQHKKDLPEALNEKILRIFEADADTHACKKLFERRDIGSLEAFRKLVLMSDNTNNKLENALWEKLVKEIPQNENDYFSRFMLRRYFEEEAKVKLDQSLRRYPSAQSRAKKIRATLEELWAMRVNMS